MNIESQTSKDAKLILQGNPRRMSRSKSPGPQTFARALNLYLNQSSGEAKTDTDDEVLSIANALILELSGNIAGAHAIYRTYTNSTEPYVQLLALFLRAWTREVDVELLEHIQKRIMSLPNVSVQDRRFRNLNLLRLITFSADGGQREFTRSLIDFAKEVVQGDLSEGVKWIANEWTDLRYRSWNFNVTREELLIPWVHQEIGADSLNQLEKILLRETRSIWAQTIEFETYSGGRSGTVAELQASWAGALWAIPSARKSQALHLWANGRSRETARLAQLWLLASGQNVKSVLSHLEVFFQEGTASQIADDLQNGARVPKHSSWYEGLGVLWDQLSYEKLFRIAHDACLTLDLKNSFATIQAEFISETAPRLGRDWLKIFDDLSSEARSLVLRIASPDWGASLTPEVRSQVLNIFHNSTIGWQGSWERAALLSTLGERHSLALEAAGELTPLTVANLGQYIEIPKSLLSSSLALYITQTQEWLSKAQAGTLGIGVSHSAVLRALALQIGVSDPLWSQTVDIIEQIWNSGSVPSMDRLSALNSLFDLQKIDRGISVARYVPSQRGLSPFNNLPDRALGVVWLTLAPSDINWDVAGVELVSASRDSDAQIRSLAASTVSIIHKKLNPGVLDSVLLAALHDPEPSVMFPLLQPQVINALGPEARAVFNTRVVNIASTQMRWIRETIARFVVECNVQNVNLPSDLEKLLINDRSWLVRSILKSELP